MALPNPSLILIVIPGVIVGFLAGLLGWQVNLVAIHRGMKYDAFATFFTGVGATMGDCVFLLLAFTSGSYFIQYFEDHRFLKWIGWVTILAISLYMFFFKPKELTQEKRTGNKGGLFRSFVVGLGMVLGNPLIFVMWFGVVGALLIHLPVLDKFVPRVIFSFGFLVGSLEWFMFLAQGSRKIVSGVEYKILSAYSKISAVLIFTVAMVVFLKELFF